MTNKSQEFIDSFIQNQADRWIDSIKLLRDNELSMDEWISFTESMEENIFSKLDTPENTKLADEVNEKCKQEGCSLLEYISNTY